jgi:hypothetical protein
MGAMRRFVITTGQDPAGHPTAPHWAKVHDLDCEQFSDTREGAVLLVKARAFTDMAASLYIEFGRGTFLDSGPGSAFDEICFVEQA